MKGENYHQAEIVGGRVGADQARSAVVSDLEGVSLA